MLYAADNNMPVVLTPNQWTLIEKAILVLSPFEELTRAVSTATASAADVIPAITVLKHHLSKEDMRESGQ